LPSSNLSNLSVDLFFAEFAHTTLLMSKNLLPALVGLLHRPIPERLFFRARLHLLDWLGCAVQGHDRIGHVLSASLQQQPAGPCNALFSGRCGWLEALQVNAGLGNVAEMDDVHRLSTLHPGPIVIPVALALTQQTQGTLKDCLVALIRGYETAIRIGRSLGAGHYAYFHNTATAGTPAAAAAASSVLGLNREQTTWAIANACSRTGGLWQMRHESVLTKQWHCIAAAIEGTLAARLAVDGLTGPVSILEGEQGLYAATAPTADPDLVEQNSNNWLIEEVSFKPWPACRHAHPAMDAARKIRQTQPLDSSTVKRVSVTTYADAIKFCDNPTPSTELSAKFSLQHSVALALGSSTIRLNDFVPEDAGFHRLASLRACVEVAEDTAFTQAYPAHFGARVKVYQDTGESLVSEVKDTWGDPEVPMSAQDIRQKAHTMMRAGGMTEESALRLSAFVLDTPLSAHLAKSPLP